MQTPHETKSLKIALLSYRSAPYGGGQGIYVKDISLALESLGHKVDVISGEPYPLLEGDVNLIKQWYEDNEKPSIDLMLMGSPCQGFSNASKIVEMIIKVNIIQSN